MRYNLESGLPVRVSDDGNRPLESRPETAFATGRLALKRVCKVWYMPTQLGYPTGWRVAYANPFIHGSFLNWFRDDATYDRTPERLAETKALYAAMGRDFKVSEHTTIGLSVIKDKS